MMSGSAFGRNSILALPLDSWFTPEEPLPVAKTVLNRQRRFFRWRFFRALMGAIGFQPVTKLRRASFRQGDHPWRDKLVA